MKKLMNHIIIMALFAMVLVSCVEEQDLRYNGPAVVEFKNYYFEKQTRLGLANFQAAYPFVVASENNSLKSITVRQAAPGITYQDSILVQLVSRQSEDDLQIGYTIDQGSTATAGVHFDFVRNEAGKVLIKANTSTGYIYVNVYNSLPAAPPGSVKNRVTLNITLTGTESVLPSENYKTFTYNITE